MTPENVDALRTFAVAALEGIERGDMDLALIRNLGVSYGLLVDVGLRGEDGDSDPRLYRLAPWLQAPG